jgi:hypothetical protein
MALLSNSRRGRAADTASPSPAPWKIEHDLDYIAYNRRFLALEAHRARLIAHQLKLEKLRQPGGEQTGSALARDEFEQAARQLLADPPGPTTLLPGSLRLLVQAKAILARAFELAQDEGRQVAQAALDRVREARSGEWRAICRQVALLAYQLHNALEARDRIFAEIGYGPLGRQPLPLSEFKVGIARVAPGAPLLEIVNAAISAGYFDKDEL